MHLHEKHQGKSFLYLITEDTQQHAKEICREAMVALQRSQDIIQTSQLARQMRQADRVERALWRNHINRMREMAKLHLPPRSVY